MFQRYLLAALLAFGGGLLLSCTDVTSPGEARHGHVALAPTLPGPAATALGASSTIIDNVRIVIRAADGTVVLDTIVIFPAGSDEVSIAADIPVHGDGERFRATIQLRSGETVLFEGTQDLDVQPGLQENPVRPVQVAYVGVGSDAASVTVSPGDLDIAANGSLQLVATVKDGAGIVIPDVPVGWASSAPEVASVSPNGVLTAGNVRGTAVITATTFGGIGGSSSAHVTLPPSQLRVAGGAAQTGRVGDLLATAFVVELVAADGIGVANAEVAFSAAGTGASISPSTATTDASGRASATLKLGTTAGAFTFSASAEGFSASVVATAVAGDANRIAVAEGNGQSAPTGTPLPLPLSVRVTDEFGNPGSGRQVNWTVVTAGSLAFPTSTTDAEGIASNTFTLPVATGEHVVYATLSTGGGVSFSATALARPPAAIAPISSPSQSGVAGTVAQPLTVRVTDALGEPVANANVNWNVSGSATVGAALSPTNANGVASVNANFGATAGASTITASIAGAESAQFTLLSLAGPAAIMDIVAGDNQTGPPGDPVPIPPSVRVSDSFGNPIAGVTVTFGDETGGGSVTGPVQVTDAAGVATVGSWILGSGIIVTLRAPRSARGAPRLAAAGAGIAQTLTATAGALSATFTAFAEVPVTPPSLFAAQGEGQIVNAFQPLQPLVVQAIDGSESGVPGLMIKFTVLSGGALPATFTTVTDPDGMASFAPTAGAAGPNVVQACVMPACSVVTDFTFTAITTGSIWTGNNSNNWSDPGNWSPAGIPGPTTDVFVPAGTPNFPALTANTFMNEFFMANGALINIGVFEMQIGSKVTTTGAAIFGAGSFRLTAGNAPITGSLPNLILNGTASATGKTNVNGNVTVEGGGRLDIGAGDMTVNGGFSVDPGGRLTMNNAAGTLTINGSAFFSGQDMGDTEITAGVLEVHGNFTATVFNQAFRAAGTHTTRLSGVAIQTINFLAASGADSRFQNLEITNTSANGITSSSDVYVAGTLVQGGNLTISSPRTLTVAGLMTLLAGSSTNVTGSLVPLGGCSNLGGIAAGFTC
jgi:hypothetical protein